MSGAVQYLRNLSLVVANPQGKGLELGALRVVFNVQRGDTQTPNTCDVRVYNLSDNTANLVNSEFTQLVLKVSYGSAPPQQIFAGSIKQIRRGRDNQKDSYLDITAADADEAYNYSTTAITLAAGTTPKDAIELMIAQMASQTSVSTPTGGAGGQQVTKGYIPELSSNQRIRGRTFYGMTRDQLRVIVAANNCKWSIQDGAVTVIPLTSFVPADFVTISPLTGLVGVPEQTQNGLQMRILMNPQIKIGQRVQLVSPDVNQLRFGTDITSAALAPTLLQTTAKLNGAGMYYVMRADHNGDTRGENWYTDLTCLAVDASIPVTSAPGAAIGPLSPAPRDAVKLF